MARCMWMRPTDDCEALMLEGSTDEAPEPPRPRARFLGSRPVVRALVLCGVAVAGVAWLRLHAWHPTPTRVENSVSLKQNVPGERSEVGAPNGGDEDPATEASEDALQTEAESDGDAMHFCARVEEGVEFHTKASPLYSVEEVISAAMCCAECDGDPECGAWTWVNKSGNEGLSQRCFLKKLAKGEKPVRIPRSNVASGLLEHKLEKHGVVAELLEKEIEAQGKNQSDELEPVAENETCPGSIDVTGHGEFFVVAAMWTTPNERANRVGVPLDTWGVESYLDSRAYLASNCTPGKYKQEEYAAFKLLGKTLRYTTDLSGVGCGCNARLYLTPMRQSKNESQCHDYLCSAHGGCGVTCSIVGVQDSNQYAWASSMHVAGDKVGVANGYGGGAGRGWLGRRDWGGLKYGPGAECIDTTWPFEVAVSFPVDEDGSLTAVEVTLSQEGHFCPLSTTIDKYSYKGKDRLKEISAVLEAGVTPVMSYWGDDFSWMDGVGADGRGPCVKEDPEACPASVSFFNFAVNESAAEGQKRARESHTTGGGSSATPLETAEGLIHESEVHRAKVLRQKELAQSALGVTSAPKNLSKLAQDCGDNCDLVASEDNITSGWQGGKEGPGLRGEGSRKKTNEKSEWEVIIAEVQVRKNKSLSANSTGTKHKGQVVAGTREGHWIRLPRGEGFVPMGNDLTDFVKERAVAKAKGDKKTDGGNKKEAEGDDKTGGDDGKKNVSSYNKTGNIEWEVITGEVDVWRHASFSAKTMGTKILGQVLIGRREGHWIRLLHERGFVPVGDDSRTFLKERMVVYGKIESGTCLDAGMFPIEDAHACKAAAYALGYFDTTLRFYGWKESRPEGCYLLGGSLYLATNAANIGHGSEGGEGGRKSLCASGSYPTTTTTTTTTTTSTTTTTWGWPSLFCFEVMMRYSYEYGLVRRQIKEGAGIFSCDEYGVFSQNGPFSLGKPPYGPEVIATHFQKAAVWKSMDGTAGNALLFVHVYQAIHKDGRYAKHDWTIKADPDAVVLPWRIRTHLKGVTNQKNYVANCNKFPQDPFYPMIYGAFEAYSKQAMQTYFNGGAKRCMGMMPWQTYGEDKFMGQCLKAIGVQPYVDLRIVGDARCYGANCADNVAAAYHDFKNQFAWFRCWKTALR